MTLLSHLTISFRVKERHYQRGGGGAHTYTCTNLRLFGVFSGSGVPDGVHVQDLHLLEENQESVVASC